MLDNAYLPSALLSLQILLVVDAEPPFCVEGIDCPPAWSTFLVPIPCMIGFAAFALLASCVMDYLMLLSLEQELPSGLPTDLLFGYQKAWSKVDVHATGYINAKTFDCLWRLTTMSLPKGIQHAGLTEFHPTFTQAERFKYPVVLWPVTQMPGSRTGCVRYMDVCSLCVCMCVCLSLSLSLCVCVCVCVFACAPTCGSVRVAPNGHTRSAAGAAQQPHGPSANTAHNWTALPNRPPRNSGSQHSNTWKKC